MSFAQWLYVLVSEWHNHISLQVNDTTTTIDSSRCLAFMNFGNVVIAFVPITKDIPFVIQDGISHPCIGILHY